MIVLEESLVLRSATFLLIGASLIIIYPHSHTHIQIREPGNGTARLFRYFSEGGLEYQRYGTLLHQHLNVM